MLSSKLKSGNYVKLISILANIATLNCSCSLICWKHVAIKLMYNYL
jgi:hypothetical protein